MSDLIDRQAVLDSLKEHRSLYCDNTPNTFSKLSYAEKSRVDELDTAIATIINLPSAENKGEWIKTKDQYETYHFTCSKCGNDIATKSDVWNDNFCSECGADMRGKENDK